MNNSKEVLNKFKSKGFKASKLSSYDFSHYFIKDKLTDLIERTFFREKALYLACNEERAFFTSDVYKIMVLSKSL